MGEFNKDQGRQDQGGKPAFGQFDKTEGQQQQQDTGQKGEPLGEGRQQEQEEGLQDELTGEQQGDDQIRREKGQGDDQAR